MTYERGDGVTWTRTVTRVDWRLLAVKPYQVVVVAPDGRRWVDRAWTEDGGWRLARRIKRRVRSRR